MNGLQKDYPELNLAKLKDDYIQGFSAFGEDGSQYYLTNWQGMQSLQAYCTSEWVHQQAGGAPEESLHEVQVTDGNIKRAMKKWDYNKFESYLLRLLRAEGVSIKRNIFTGSSHDIYEAVINTVFNGKLDRTAFLEAMTSAHSPMMRYDVENALKLDILRTLDGRTDRFARAGAFAYTHALAPKARLVDFSGDLSDDLTDYRRGDLLEDEWLRQADRLYVETLMSHNDEANTYPIESAREIVKHISDYTPNFMARRQDEWDDLRVNLQNNFVFFFDKQ